MADSMVSLLAMETRLREGGNPLTNEESTMVLELNARDGSLFREAAREGYVHVIRFFLAVRDHYDLTRELQRKCSLEGEVHLGGGSPMHGAASCDHADIVHCCFTHGVLFHAPDAGGDTALHIACEAGKENVVRMFLEHEGTSARPIKASINAVNRRGQTALHLAKAFPLQKFLIGKGADPHVHGLLGQTVLHLSDNPEYTLFLLQQGVLVDARDNDRNTPLLVAIAQGRDDVAKLLVEYGASVDAKNVFGACPLRLSLERENHSFARFLLENGADANA